MSTLIRDYERFAKEAKEICKGRVYTDHLRRYAYGVDASCYSYLPKVVVKAEDEREVRRLIRLCQQCGTPFTFRAAGSSLSGQCSSEDVLIVCNDGFKKMEVIDDGKALKCECGVIGSDANDLLKPYNRKIGPDPATLATALVGGILNNNSSGMCCGTAQNSYKTIRSIRVVLLDGSILDTSDQKSIDQFLKEKPQMVEDILQLRKEILADEELTHLIHHKYKIKNTTGYGLNSLVDFEDIIDIINHLFIGSEGTLGIITELTLKIIPAPKASASLIVPFEDLKTALETVPKLKMSSLNPQAIEFMEREIVLASERHTGRSTFPREMEGQPVGAYLLITLDSDSEDQLYTLLEQAAELVLDAGAMDVLVADSPAKMRDAWAARSAFLEVIMEETKLLDECDVVVPVTKIASYLEFVNKTGEECGLVIRSFGHAGDGNLHIYECSNDLTEEEFKKRVDKFFDLIYKEASAQGGLVSGEHGIGSGKIQYLVESIGETNMALMEGIKRVFDPKMILNPGKVCYRL